MTTDTKNRILGYLKTNGQGRVKDLVQHLQIGNVAVHRQLKRLVDAGKLIKSGKPPTVFYRLLEKTQQEQQFESKQMVGMLENTYVYIDPVGQIIPGMTGFKMWATRVGKTDQIESLVKRYLLDRQWADSFKSKQGWIDAVGKTRKTFGDEMFLDGVYYKDFYSLQTFGKTRLGQFVLYGKQSENRELMWQTADESKQLIMDLIKYLEVEAVGFLPHSILRKVQFLKEFSKRLELKLPQISLVKAYSGGIRVAQKTLGRLEERVENARKTIFIDSRPGQVFDKVLLIDDAVGSGATLNETAKKLKELGMAKQVYGFAVVGSMKGFEIIREV